MSQVALVNVSKSFGGNLIVDNLNLSVEPGEFITLLGASGSGKTTCLRMLAGFARPDRGKVMLGGVDATALPPYRRNTGMVFQHYALFPHLSVADNIAYGLRARRCSNADIRQRTRAALQMVDLEAQAERHPSQLSGGQRQRVALARAIVIRPSILLLDEPLSALDLKLRETLQVEIRRIQQQLGMTTLFVTHDQGEALAMSDRVAIMQQGRIMQIAAPVTLYQRPASRWIASFLGSSNFFDVVVSEHRANPDTPHGRYTLALRDDARVTFEVDATESVYAPGQHCVLSVRPENMRLQGEWRNRIKVTVDRLHYSGERWTVDCSRQDGKHALSLSIFGLAPVPAVGEEVMLGWAAGHGVLMRADDASGQ